MSRNVETGEQVRNTRIPITVVKTAARFVPASIFAKIDERLTKDIARDILDAVPKMIDEIARQPVDADSGFPGLISYEETRHGGVYAELPLPEGSSPPEEWTERVLVYIE
ncbi:MAG: hypothetical protein AAFQ43_08975 [Bacteroidota bacterium]